MVSQATQAFLDLVDIAASLASADIQVRVEDLATAVIAAIQVSLVIAAIQVSLDSVVTQVSLDSVVTQVSLDSQASRATAE